MTKGCLNRHSNATVAQKLVYDLPMGWPGLLIGLLAAGTLTDVAFVKIAKFVRISAVGRVLASTVHLAIILAAPSSARLKIAISCGRRGRTADRCRCEDVGATW